MGGRPLLLVEADPQLRERWLRALPLTPDVVSAAEAEQALEAFVRTHPRRVVLGRPAQGETERIRLALLAEMTSLDPKASIAVVAGADDAEGFRRSALRMGAFAVTGADAGDVRRVVAEMANEERVQRLASQLRAAP